VKPDDRGRGKPSQSFTGSEDLDRLGARLGHLARTLQGADSVASTLDGVVHAAVETVPGTGHAGITQVVGRRALRTTAGTDELVYRIDAAQYEAAEGPCLSALYEERTVRLSDMAAEQRWPAFTGRATALGVRSMLSFQLYVTEENLGALNLYAPQAGAFTDESEQIGLLFATHAAVAVADTVKLRQLTRALDVRDLIGQAKGILMERHRLSGDQAFTRLVRASQSTNTKLVEVARRLVETGELPGRS
jgi:hypothetical protein